jgi:TonB-linked SusC/RagA family outer membrane protein
MKMKRWALLLALALLPAGTAAAQSTGQVTGVVTDAAGAPVAGAAVAVQGTTRGDETGADGRFTITQVPAGAQQVRVSKIGFSEQTKSVTVAAGQTAAVSFQLSAAVVQLEQVVAVGYGTARKQDVTGAVASVNAEAIKEIPTPSVGEALKGRIAGVDIETNSYKPGDSPDIRIRGIRSLEASNSPLIVVDGVAIAGGIEDISPGSIEAIDVLKDASATAVYGSRGANGVIMITTKKGRPGGTRFQYDTRYGMEQIHTKVNVFDGPGYAEWKREAYRAVGKYNCPADANGYRAPCDVGDKAIFDVGEYAGMQAGVSTDWMDLISRTGALQDHQLSITGGNATTRFSIGGNFMDEKGVTLGQSYLRRGATISLNHDSGKFTAGMSANVSNSLQNLGRGDGEWGEAMAYDPMVSPYFEDGTLNPTASSDPQMWNPLVEIDSWKHDILRTRTFGNAFVGYELLPGLKLQTTFGADLAFRRDGQLVGANTDTNRGVNNQANVNRFQTFNYVSTTQAQIDRDITDSQRLSATFLYEIQSQNDDESRAAVSNLPYESQLYYNIGSAGQVNSVSSDYSAWLLQSFMGRANYILNDRYYLTLTGRQDCSSRLAPGNKCAFFPSAAVKWRLSDESFLQNQSLFSDLSLRLSWGKTGNTSIDPYQTQGLLDRTTYSFGAGSGAYGYRPRNLPNPALKWENTAQYDVAVEFGMLDNRISGTVDAYLANTTDLLMERQLPTTSGFGNALENVGATRNKGLEVALSTVNFEDFHGLGWTSNINWTANRNEIVSLYGGYEDDIGSGWFIGRPISVYYYYEGAGIWQPDEADEAKKYGRKVGQIKVVDQNGDGRISADGDRVIQGNHHDYPSWTGSFSNRLTYGDFDLSALATARWGYTIRSTMWPGANAARYNQPSFQYWTPQNPVNTYPQPLQAQESATDNEAVQLFNGSHWRVRNITLGYSVPSSVIGRLGEGSSLRLYVQAQDPWVFTSFPGFDPEGGDDAAVPSYRTLLVGASVGF